MIHKLISKSQVRLLEYEGNPSQDYKDGYCRAIHDVLDLEPIPTLGADEYEKFKADYETRLKADMASMLEEISLKFDEQYYINRHQLHDDSLNKGLQQGQDIILQKINALKGDL